jgi:type VI secretion system protein ImpH
MAEPDGSQAHTLIAELTQTPYAFDFLQAVRRLECAHPDKPRIGTSSRAIDDPVRFGQDPSMAFAPASISSVTTRTNGVPRMAIACIGMLGPNGPLPLHITAYARERQLSHKDSTFVHFVDLLSHRFISLFYRAWAVNQKTVSSDRPQTDRWMAFFASIVGMGEPTLRERDRIPDAAKVFYAGRLASQVRGASGLGKVLADFFGVAAEIQQFIGQWVNLPDDCCCRLGESKSTGRVGSSVIIGARVWDCQMKFRVRMGPMSLPDYQRFLPGTPSLHRLHDWVRLYSGDELEWDVQLILRKEEVPALRLGQSGNLGWSTWIGNQPHVKDAEDVILSSAVAA